ncbi:PssE/Cps14G family polysaccharide biosynthesis glycosyltransferase [Paenibacillus sp. GCM10023250]|uniref:PssE/Cps14G family polysaccharide biosynthesis glycosyltransferase n=1 Tax=Paenibacillus sp. GCM10023250 TaxID=3252648 RepID=UPI003617DE90
MIFVTVGTQKFQFDRLIKKMDQLVGEARIQLPVIGQIGYSNYRPKHFQAFDMLNAQQVSDYFVKSDIIITHAGTSSIIQGLKREKKMIVVPRQLIFNEHIDNHQLEIAKVFEEKQFVEAVYDIEELPAKLEGIQARVFNKYIIDNSNLLLDLEKYILAHM